MVAGVAALCVLAALALAAPAGAARVYVALGDSYTSGPLVPNPKGEPIDCGRSDRNCPTIVATRLGVPDFRDISCGSAQTRHMTEPQTRLPLGGTNPPQFTAMGPESELVTVGIGGNDMGFGTIVNTCVEMGTQSLRRGQPCTDHFTAGGRDRIAERLRETVAPRLAHVIHGIQVRAPRARLLVVGYPDPLPEPPGCYPVLPIAPGDLPYLHGVARRLHETVRGAAVAGGAEYVELLSGSAGHDVCQLPGVKWYEGVVPTSPAYPAHPNDLGLDFAARQVLDVLRRPVPNDFAILSRRAGRRGVVSLRLRAPHRGRFQVRAMAFSRHPGGVRRTRGRAIRYAAAEAFAARAGELVLRLTPSRSVRRALARDRRMTVRVWIAFDPVAGDGRTRSTTVRVKAPRRSGR